MIMTMNNKKISLLIAFTMLACLTLSAQGRKNVRINEVMVQADTAGAPGWVEFYNSSYGSNAIEKMFITIAPFNEVESIFDRQQGPQEGPPASGTLRQRPRQVLRNPARRRAQHQDRASHPLRVRS